MLCYIQIQKNNSITTGKTLNKSWVAEESKPFSFNNVYYDRVYWRDRETTNNIKNIVFKDKINIYNLSMYFSLMKNVSSINYGGLNINTIINMSETYYFCDNLTGSPVCGSNVTDMSYTYGFCYSLKVDTSYFYSHNVSNAKNCFCGKSKYRRYNIHIPANSITLNTFLKNDANSIVGEAITWTNQGTYYYNTTYNIYIYPNSSL